MKGINICTIVSKNYLAHARTLINSFLENNPEGQAYVLLVDKLEEYFDKSKERFHIIELHELPIADMDSFCFKYNCLELNTAAKPFFLSYLFENYKLDKLIYFDPDILINKKLEHLNALLNDYSIIITPHITKPMEDDGFIPGEIGFLKAGSYNLGFIALAYNQDTKMLLRWWSDRLHKYCVNNPSAGLFVDQKWVDLVPSIFNNVYILKNPEYNVSYWNLQEREFAINNDKVYINNRELVFFHFSGFPIDNFAKVSKHQNRFRLGDVKHLECLFTIYKDKLLENGYHDVKEWPYYYDYFDNGVKIPEVARRVYYKLISTGSDFGNPFKTEPPNSFYNWLLLSANEKSEINNLLYRICQDNVQNIYNPKINVLSHPDVFLEWFQSLGNLKYRISSKMLFAEEITQKQVKLPIDLFKLDILTFIENIYRFILMREPDNRGLRAILSKSREGVPRRKILIEFLHFSEVKNYGVNEDTIEFILNQQPNKPMNVVDLDNDKFIYLLFDYLLETKPTKESLDCYLKLLDEGLSKEKLLWMLMKSDNPNSVIKELGD